DSALVISGALVDSSGAILSYIMCKGMNCSFISVILGGFGGEWAGPAAGTEQRPVKLGSAEDAAYLLKNSSRVIIVPGYGMAVAQAQHALREMGDKLKAGGVDVSYAIHPVVFPGQAKSSVVAPRRHSGPCGSGLADLSRTAGAFRIAGMRFKPRQGYAYRRP